MAEHFSVDSSQLYKHATNVKAVCDQFAAIKGASQAISADSAAYGLLCGWISGILERRHQGQNQLYDYLEQNLALAADAIRTTGREYDSSDKAAHGRIKQAGGLS